MSIDGFHRPRAERLAAGTGPDGFYRGSYRYDAFRAAVVEPVRQGRAITPAVWDVARDAAVEATPVATAPDAVVLVDGIFLQRAELRDIWDAAVWVHAPFAVTVPRGNARFGPEFEADPEAPGNHRYVGGQRLYLAETRPAELADWVLDNTDLDDPRLHCTHKDRGASSHRGSSGPTTHRR